MPSLSAASVTLTFALMVLACGHAPTPPLGSSVSDAARAFVPATDHRVAVMGRVNANSDGSLSFGYPGVSLRLRFRGTSLAWRASSTTGDSRVALIVDGATKATLRLGRESTPVTIFEGLPGREHDVEVVHRTEAWQGIVTVEGLLPDAGGALLDPKPWPDRRLLIIGDSVTSGEGVERASDCSGDKPAASNAHLSYGMLLARALDAQVHLISYGGRGLIRDWQGNAKALNAPQFFNLAIPEEGTRVLWNHASYQPDVVLISLGTNDFNLKLGALPERKTYVSAYVTFVRAIRAVYRHARIFLTEGAMLNDAAGPARPQKTTLRAYIADTVQAVGDERVSAILANHYPGDACDSHPTGEQHAAMARDLEPLVRQAMTW